MSESSQLFEEFIIRRCEEITQGNKESQELNSKVLHIECDFKKMLNPEQLQKYHELEATIIDLATHNEILIYKQALNDRVQCQSTNKVL